MMGHSHDVLKIKQKNQRRYSQGTKEENIILIIRNILEDKINC